MEHVDSPFLETVSSLLLRISMALFMHKSLSKSANDQLKHLLSVDIRPLGFDGKYALRHNYIAIMHPICNM